MIIDKLKKVGEILGTVPDLGKVVNASQLFGIIHKGRITALPVSESTLASVDRKFLFISPYPTLAAAISKKDQRPVWLYDRLEDIKNMRLPGRKGPGWVILASGKNDIVPANILADHWTNGPHDVSVLIGEEQDLMRNFSDLYKPTI